MESQRDAIYEAVTNSPYDLSKTYQGAGNGDIVERSVGYPVEEVAGALDGAIESALWWTL